jgi:hypothetical protein
MADQDQQREEVRLNFEVFKREEPELRFGHLKDFAIYRSQKRVAIKSTFYDALKYAYENYPDGRWSIQEIGQDPIYTRYG